jgi:hypothetical protein
MNTSRRNFIKTSGLGVSATVLSPWLAACTKGQTAVQADQGAVVRLIDGVPELFVNGERSSRMWGRLALPADLAPEKMDQYLPAGIDTYLTAIDATISLCWDGEDGYYFDKYEAHVRRLVEKLPEIKLILYTGGTGGSPYKWCKNNQEELTLYDSGIRLETASIASDIWLRDSSKAFGEFVKYFENSKYADNIIGYNPVFNANEWFSHHRKSTKEFGWADFSKPMLNYYREWLKKEYNNDVQALRESWNNDNITFETVKIPTAEERLYDENESFFYTCTPLGNKIADYYRAYDQRLAQLGIAWCKAIKEAAPVPKLAGMMHGYSYCGRHDSSLYPHHHGHGAAMMVMNSEWVDFLHSPYHYYNRSIDGTHYSQHAVDTVTNHGKLMLDQIDSKPHLRGAPNWNASTPWESEQLLKRDVSYPLTKNIYTYWLEGGPGNMFPIVRHHAEPWGHMWFDSPEIKQLIANLKQLVDENQQLNTQSVTEVAFFTSNVGSYYRKLEKVFGNLYVEGLRQWVLPEVGAPFDDYILEDLPNIDKQYKVYIFSDCHYIPSDMRQKIIQKLEADQATAIWLYGPGYLSEEGCNLDTSAALTGIQLGKSEEKGFIQVEITNTDHPIGQGLQGVDYGSDIDPTYFTDDIVWMPFHTDTQDYQFTPVFYANDPDAEVIGQLKGLNQPGLVYKDLGNRKSVYSSAPMLQPEVLRNILENAGVHIYSRGHDLIYANDTYVSLTAYEAGERVLTLPQSRKISDALSGEVLAENSEQIAFDAQQYETRIFKLGPESA